MKAAVLTAPGSVPALAEFAEPELQPGEQLFELVAGGIHPIVRAMAAGEHYGAEGAFPRVPGIDAVARDAEGRLVYTGWVRAPWGTFAERIATRGGFPLPEGADPVAIAAGMNPGLSGWMPLLERADEGPLGTVLVLGATGVAGALAVQSALAVGADHVIAAGRDAGALDALRGDRREVVRLGTGELAAALAAHRPRTVLDFVWGAPAEETFAALTRHGLDEDGEPLTYIEIGQAAGAGANVPAALLRSAAVTLRGSGAGSGDVGRIMATIPEFMERIARGEVVVPTVDRPLTEIGPAWNEVTPGRRMVVTA